MAHCVVVIILTISTGSSRVLHTFTIYFATVDVFYSTLVGSVALLVARRTNDRKVAGSRPTKVVDITMLTGNRMGVNCGRPPLLLPSCGKLEFRLSALMDSDLAWVNGKSGRQR